MKASRFGTLISAGLYFLASLALIALGIIFGPPPGNIPIFQIIAVTVAFLFFGKVASLLLIGNSSLPKSAITSGLIQYCAIVVLTALSFESLCGYFFIEGVPFHDNASFYSLFHDNLQSLNYFGSPAWWFPHNQFGFPGYFFSILGDMNCLSPVFVSLSFIFWMLGALGVHITNIMPLYIWYFGAIVPFLFSLSIWFLARQILTSSTALVFIAILSAFSPGVILNFGDIGFLEAAAYGLFLAASYIRFIGKPGSHSFLTLTLSILIFAVTTNYALIIWNLLFLAVLFTLTLFPKHSLIKVRTAFSSIRKKKWAIVAVLFVVSSIPSLLAFSQQGDIIRTTLVDEENKYLHLSRNPGNPLEPLLAGTPGVGVMGKNTEKGPHVLYPIVLGNGYMFYTYLGLLVIPFSIIGLLYGQTEWRVRLLILIIVFFMIFILASFSPLFLLLLSLKTPLTQNSHFSDLLYRGGAFALLIIAAGMGLDALQKNSELYKKTIGLFVLSVSMSCVLHLYLSHDNPIILGLILGFTIILGLSYFVVLAWLMNNQLGVYRNPVIGLLLLLVVCDVSTISHLHVRYVMFPNFPKHKLIDFDAQNKDKIGVSHYWPNGMADTVLSSKALMTLQKNEFQINDLPQYALFKNGHISHNISQSDFENAIKKQSIALDSESIKSEKISSFLGTHDDNRSIRNSEVILDKKTYTLTQWKVRTDEEALLFIRDGYHPYWKAMINDRETKIFRSMQNFKAIIIPKGESTVRFQFSPPGISVSIAVAYLSIFAVAVMWMCNLCSLYRTTKIRRAIHG